MVLQDAFTQFLSITRCKIAAVFAQKLFFCFLQFLYGVFGVLCYTESGKNP